MTTKDASAPAQDITTTTADDDPHDREYWTKRISGTWQKAVESIIETGRLLIEAKSKLNHGEFTGMVLPFTMRTAEMLMKIAEHPVISNAKHVSLLPPSWGTLYQLAKLPPEVLEAKIENGTVNSKIERKDVAVMVAEIRGPREHKEPSEFAAPDEVAPSASGPVELARKLQSALDELDRANAHIEELESALEIANARIEELEKATATPAPRTKRKGKGHAALRKRASMLGYFLRRKGAVYHLRKIGDGTRIGCGDLDGVANQLDIMEAK
jgi:hypothetical protein